MVHRHLWRAALSLQFNTSAVQLVDLILLFGHSKHFFLVLEQTGENLCIFPKRSNPMNTVADSIRGFCSSVRDQRTRVVFPLNLDQRRHEFVLTEIFYTHTSSIHTCDENTIKTGRPQILRFGTLKMATQTGSCSCVNCRHFVLDMTSKMTFSREFHS